MLKIGKYALIAFAVALSLLVLLVLFTPVLSDRREINPRPQCLSNLKQLGLAIGMYADQNGGRLPMDSATPTLVGSMKLLSNVASSAAFLYCPNDSRPDARPEADFSKLTTKNISYSYVPNLIWQDIPDSAIALDRIYASAAGSSWPTNGNHMGRDGRVHGGNILFNDGHVAWDVHLPSGLKGTDGKEIVLSP